MAGRAQHAPELESTLDCLRGLCKQPLTLVLVCYPTSHPGRVAVAVELRLQTTTTAMALVRRWGEEVSTKSPTAFASAAYRAALQAHMWCDGKSPEELVRWARWEVGAREFKA